MKTARGAMRSTPGLSGCGAVFLRSSAVALLALGACRTPRTEIVLVVESEFDVGPGADVEGIAVVVRSADTERYRTAVLVGDGTNGRLALPATLGLLPSGDYAGEALTVDVYGCGAGGCAMSDPAVNAFVAQRAVVTFSRGETNELRVRLARSCRWVRCDEGLTCDPGTRECVDPHRVLPAYSQDGDAVATDGGRPAVATALAAGGDHSCALGSDGVARCWGDNRQGQLGDGTTAPRNGAAHVAGTLAGAIQIAAGLDHTCVLSREGTVQCWGDNAFGQLGTEAAPGTLLPGASVAALSNVVQIAAGARHTCAVLRDGGVRCWGDNRRGQLGGGGAADRSAQPVGVLDGAGELRNAVEVAAGDAHSCAWLRDGSVRCWGDNREGQLGDGGAEDVARVAVVVPGVDHVVGLAGGAGHTCARTSANIVWCWGRNDRGQLGGDLLDRASSAAVPTVNLPANVADLASGADHVCVRTVGGQVWCWGDNESFQLADTSGFRRTPALIASDVVARELAAGRAHTCVVRDGGEVGCWGDNTFAQRGQGATFDRVTPGPVQGVDGARLLVAGDAHACALRADGTAVCWGGNRHGQLGDGTQSPRGAPVRVANVAGISDLSAGAGYTCAILQPPRARTDVELRAQQLYCWGANQSGQLGNGTIEESWVPSRVPGLNGAASVGMSLGFGGRVHTCATDAVGRAFCWGDGALGQFGSEIVLTAPALAPMRTSQRLEEKGGSVIRAGGGFTCFGNPDASPQIFCAGRNDAGQLGPAASGMASSATWTSYKFDPEIVRGLTVGRDHACVWMGTGIRCWGGNGFGQVGAPASMPSVPTAVLVPGAGEGAFAVSAGATHTCAVAATAHGDAVLCWGDNRDGELGDGTRSSRESVQPVPGLQNPTSVASGDGFTCAIADPNGQVYCWGRARDGQLGLGAQPGDQLPSTVEGW